MATFLYRLGRLAYRRRWRFVAAWALILVLIGGAAGAFMGTLINSFTIPGTETQRTLDRLKTELPEFAGGTGSIVYRTTDGSEFTGSQRTSIAAALDRLRGVDGVREIRDPFELQSDLDGAQDEVADARRMLADGRNELNDGRRQLDDGKRQLADGRKQLTDGQKRLAAGKVELEDGRGQLTAVAAELSVGQHELDAAKARLADGVDRLEAGRAKLVAGQRDYDAGSARIASGAERLTAGQARLTRSESELADGSRQYEAGAARLLAQLDVDSLSAADGKLDDGQSAVNDATARLTATETALNALRAQRESVESDQNLTPAEREERLGAIDARIAGMPDEREIVAQRDGVAARQASIKVGRNGLDALTASKERLDAGSAQLDDARQTLSVKERELAAGRAELAVAKQNLSSGWAELGANESTLDAAAARVRAGEATLKEGAAAVETNRAKLAAGDREIAATETKLAEGERTLDQRAAEIPAAERKLADGARDLEAGQEQLALGERQAASTEGMRFVSADGTTAAASLTFVGSTDSLTAETRAAIQEIAAAPEAQGVEAYYSKEIVQDLSSMFGMAEVIGLAVAAAVLLAMLGTLIAAGLPLVMAVLGVAAGVGGTLALSSAIEMASITPALALMLGLAVGIDYSLFIVHRHRRQLLDGMDLEESIGRATGTSGNAVVFAGLTVVIALAALAVPGLPFLSVLGLSAAFTVAVAVLIALTLTPALLGIIGTRLIGKRAWAKAERGKATRSGNDDEARGWGAVATRRPWLTAAVSILVLGIIAIPAAQMRTALPDGGAEPVESSAHQAYEHISDSFGGGYNGPVIVVADLPEGLDARGATEANLDVADALRGFDGVVAAVPVAVNDANTVGVIQVIPRDGPASEATEELVHTLRAAADGIRADTGSSIALTGQVTAQVDVSERLAEVLPTYLAIVVGLSLILLLLVFRSVVVPVVATAGFLLSLMAAFGATVAVYQWGWLGSVLAVETPGPIMSFLPILLTGILFGLAMDYQVFLVSAMREAYAHGQDARAAVRSGFAHSAPVVTAAALIMGSVFAGFVFSHLTMIRAIGFSLAVGVLFDAFIVRMTLTPAVMYLLGDKAWYIPRWLDRILPDVDVEGANLDAASGLRDPDREASSDDDSGWFFDDHDGNVGTDRRATVDA